MNSQEMLKSLGIEDINENLLNGYKNLANLQIKEKVGLQELPIEYNDVVAMRTVGLYLSFLNGIGKLKLSDNIEDTAISSLTQGDVSVSFKNDKSQSQKQEDLISYFINYGDDWLRSFIVWE